MRQRLLVIIILMLAIASTNIWAQKTEADLHLIYQFKELSGRELYDETGDRAPWIFTPENLLYTVTPDQREYRVYDSNFTLLRRVESPNVVLPGGRGRWLGGSLSYSSGASGSFILLMQGKDYVLHIPRSAQHFGGPLYGDLLVKFDGPPGSYYGYQLPKDPAGEVVRINTDDFMDNLRNGVYRDRGLWIRDNTLMYQENIVSIDDVKHLFGKSFGWMGIDKDSNYLNYNTVHDKHANLIQTISIKSSVMLPTGETDLLYEHPFYDHEGNYYIFGGYSHGPGNLYYIGRDWGYTETKKAILNNNRVRIRLHPTTTDIILGQVDAGEQVTVLTQTDLVETIGGLTAKWYKVKLHSGLVGWLFGSYLDFVE